VDVSDSPVSRLCLEWALEMIQSGSPQKESKNFVHCFN